MGLATVATVWVATGTATVPRCETVPDNTRSFTGSDGRGESRGALCAVRGALC